MMIPLRRPVRDVFPALLLLLLAGVRLCAQEHLPAMIGVRLGMDQMPLQSADSMQWFCACPAEFDAAALPSTYPRPWLGLFFWDPTLISERLGVQIRLMFGQAASELNARRSTGVVDINNNPVVAELAMFTRRDAQPIMLDLLATATLPWGFIIAVGPAFEYRWSIHKKVGETFIRPDRPKITPMAGVSIEDSGRTIIYYQGEDSAAQRLHVTACGALEYPIALGFRSWIIPEILTHWEITARDSEAVRPRLGVGAGLTFAVAIGQKDTEAVMVAPPPTVVPPAATLSLYHLDAGGVRHDTDAVHPVMILHHRSMRLPPLLFFDAGATAIPSRYLQPVGAGDSLTSAIGRLDLRDAGHHVLDVVGAWARAHQSDGLRLRVVRAEHETPAVAAVRAETVRAYLVQRWRLDGRRIVTALEGQAVVGSPFVRFESISGVSVTDVVSTWRERRLIPDPIRVEPEVHAERGLRRWDLVITHNGRTLARRSSDDSSNARMNLALVIGDTATAGPPASLEAVLSVEDSAGTSTVARATMPLVIAPGTEVTQPEPKISLVLPAGNDVASLRPDSIVASAPRGGRIRLSCFGPLQRSAPIIDALRVAAAARGVEVIIDDPLPPIDDAPVNPEDDYVGAGVVVTYE